MSARAWRAIAATTDTAWWALRVALILSVVWP